MLLVFCIFGFLYSGSLDPWISGHQKLYLAKRITVHCLVPVSTKMMILKIFLNYCALLGTRTNSHNDGKSIGAGMVTRALLLAVITVTLIVQLILNVTMIATMVLITII